LGDLKRILIVDDEPKNQRLIKDFLQVGLGFVTIKASYQIASHMNTKDIFLAYHHLMSRGTRIHGKLSDIGNNEGGSSGRSLKILFISRSAWPKI